MAIVRPLSNRVDFHRALTEIEVDALVSHKDLRVLQTVEAVEPKTWKLLNSRFFPLRPDVELRVYGHYGGSCDLSFVQWLSNVRRFSADCLMEAEGVEHITRLSQLRSLAIGIHSLENLDFLNDLDADHLTNLTLGPTASKKPRLRVIERFAQINCLCIAGQNKDIEVIGRLPRLQDLTLRSITVPALSFLRGLAELWSVDIKLGGTTNLTDLGYLTGVKYLGLFQVKGLSDLCPIGEMTGLPFLFLQSLRNVVRLPDFCRLTALRRVFLENLKGLGDLAPVESAPALEEFVHVSAQGMESTQYACLLGMRTLKRMRVGFGSDRKNEALRGMMKLAGVEEYEHEEFAFV